jgi:hypothetical protein
MWFEVLDAASEIKVLFKLEAGVGILLQLAVFLTLLGAASFTSPPSLGFRALVVGGARSLGALALQSDI